MVYLDLNNFHHVKYDSNKSLLMKYDLIIILIQTRRTRNYKTKKKKILISLELINRKRCMSQLSL